MSRHADSYLNIHAAEAWHGDAYIVGTVRGLIDLRNAIDTAIKNHAARPGEPARTCFVSMVERDGEGFTVRVACVAQAELACLRLPYTDEIAREQLDGATWPSELFRDQMKAEESESLRAVAEENRRAMLRDHGPFCGPAPTPAGETPAQPDAGGN